jgi:hypothetical protein
MSRYIDFDYSTKGLAINLPNGTIKSNLFQVDLICDGVNWCIIGQEYYDQKKNT